MEELLVSGIKKTEISNKEKVGLCPAPLLIQSLTLSPCVLLLLGDTLLQGES